MSRSASPARHTTMFAISNPMRLLRSRSTAVALLSLSFSAFLSVGCARSFEALGTGDGGIASDTGGGRDTGPLSDGGGVFCQAPITLEQAGCLGLDAPSCATCHTRAGVWCLRPMGVGVPPGETPPLRPIEECVPECEGTLALVDTTPIVLEGAGPVYPVSLSREGSQFWLAYRHTNPTPCDGSCFGVRSLSGLGPIAEFNPAYWMEGLTGSDAALSAHSSGSTGALLVGRDRATLTWQSRPLRGEGWMEDARVSAALDTEFAAVGPGASGSVLIATWAPDFDTDGYHEGLTVERRSITGAVIGAVTLPPALSSASLRSARIIAGIGSDGDWIAAVESERSTVAVGHTDGRVVAPSEGFCPGHAGFSAAALAPDVLVTAQNCGDGVIDLELRGSRSGTLRLPALSQTLSPSITVVGELILVAYVELLERTPTLVVVRARGTDPMVVEQSIRLPGGALIDPAGAVSVESLADAEAVAVAWNTVSPDPSPDSGQVAIVRLRGCTRLVLMP